MNFFLRRTASISMMIMVTALCAVTFITHSAHAQNGPIYAENYIGTLAEAPLETVLRIYVAKNENYTKSVETLLKRNIRTISHSCRKIEHAERDDVFKYQANIIFPTKRLEGDTPGHPDSGQWKDSFKLAGCDRTYIFNFLSTAVKDNEPSVLPLVNGESKIDPIYQLIAEQKAYDEIKKYAPQLCEAGGHQMVYDTHFIGYIQENKSLGAENKKLGWFEEWDIWYCQELKKVKIAVVEEQNQVFNILVKFKNE